MEEFNASAGTRTGPEDRAASASAALDAGRLGGVLLRLHRERFDGVLNIAWDEHTAAVGFREGIPVTLDDPTPGHVLADQFVERGQLTREQCNRVLARMTDALVDDEAVAFFEHTVQLGFLTEDEANVELESRVRARMIQLFSLRDCATSLTPGVAELLDRRESPQNVGAVLYMGVRTFYDEELLNSCHPDLSRTYVRLTAPPATIAQFFGLDDEEFQLLRRIQPDDPASQLVETRKVERVHLLALLLLMRMAQFCEVWNHPQPRATSPRMPHARAPRARTELSREDKSVARRAPSPPELPREDRSVARKAETPPAATHEDSTSTPPQRRDHAFARAGELPPTPPRQDWPYARTGDVPPEPPPRQDWPRARTGEVPPEPPPREDRSVARKAPTPPEPAPTLTPPPPPIAARAAQAAREQAARGPLLDPPAPGRSARPSVDATQEALLEAAARTARMRRSLPARRNSRQADGMPAPAAEGGGVASKMPETAAANANIPAKAQTAEPGPEYAKAHLKELIARRKNTASAPESAAQSNQRDPARELREARGLLQAQSYTRAEKVLSALVELHPANDVYKAYHLWARWRAQPEAADSGLNELQELAKKLVSDSEHGGFAAYMLGHVFLHNKRDDLAEKFFKRAHAADRGNKDAERHLIILERRKQTAAEGGPGANRKLFGIQLPNKPKP